MNHYARHAIGDQIWVDMGLDPRGKPTAERVTVDAVVIKAAGVFYEVHVGYSLVVPDEDTYASWEEFYWRKIKPEGGE
jgi:hypothetical protein